MKRLVSDRGLAVLIAVFCLLLAGSMVLSALALKAGQQRDEQLARQAAALRDQGTFVKRLAAGSNRALCALRGDLENRVRQTDKFLHDHPRGIPGIPAATLRTNANGQRRTIRALSNLRCG
jgi:hypothetical protein